MFDPALLSFVTLTAPIRDTPAGSTPLLIALAPCVRLDDQVGCPESLDAPDDLTEEPPCQVAVSQLKDDATVRLR